MASGFISPIIIFALMAFAIIKLIQLNRAVNGLKEEVKDLKSQLNGEKSALDDFR